MKNTTMAQKIKELRLRSGSSQEELADKTQLSLRTIQRIENGETQPRGDSLKRLALALGVPTEELTELMELGAEEVVLEQRGLQRREGQPEAEGLCSMQRAAETESDRMGERPFPTEKFREQADRHPVGGFQQSGLREDKGFLAVLHLSALGFLLFPGFLLLPAMGILMPLTLWLWKKDQVIGVREAGKKILNFQLSWFLVFALVFGNVAVTKLLHIPSVLEHGTLFRILIGLYLFNLVTIIVNLVRLGSDKAVVYRPAIPFMPVH